MSKKSTLDKNSSFFWSNASDFLNNEMPVIRKKSTNTVDAYRCSLNKYINFLAEEKSIKKPDISCNYMIPTRPSIGQQSIKARTTERALRFREKAP